MVQFVTLLNLYGAKYISFKSVITLTQIFGRTNSKKRGRRERKDE